MVMVTNNAKGPRGFNVGKRDADMGENKKGTSVQTVVLMPGESKDLDLHDANHPTVKGMVDGGEVVIGSAKPDPVAPKPKFVVDGLNDDELRAFIKDRTGKDADPKADKVALQTQARTLAVAP